MVIRYFVVFGPGQNQNFKCVWLLIGEYEGSEELFTNTIQIYVGTIIGAMAHLRF